MYISIYMYKYCISLYILYMYLKPTPSFVDLQCNRTSIFTYQVNIYSYSVYTCPLANFRIVCLLCLHFRTLHAYIYSPLCCDRVFSLSSVHIDKVNAFYNYSKRASAGWVCSRSVLMDFVPFSHTDTHIEPNRQLDIHTQLNSHTLSSKI